MSSKILLLLSIVFSLFLTIGIFGGYDHNSGNNLSKDRPQPLEAPDELWNYSTDGEIQSSAALKDLNKDGKLEVIFGSLDLFRSNLYKELTKKKKTYKFGINVQRTEDNKFQMKPVCSTVFEDEDNLINGF